MGKNGGGAGGIFLKVPCTALFNDSEHKVY